MSIALLIIDGITTSDGTTLFDSAKQEILECLVGVTVCFCGGTMRLYNR